VTAAPKFQYASDQSLMIYFGDRVDIETHRRVLKLLRLTEREPVQGVRNLHPAYCSMLVVFDPVLLSHAAVERIFAGYVERSDSEPTPEPQTVEIPVRYGGEYGPDLEAVARFHSITPERVIELHSSATYVVYFLGFAPGFPYLGGLPEALATPRLETPRKRVPRGSVAIGGAQTGVYPFETPGGWRLIGRTPLALFDRETGASHLAMGDLVRFRPVSE
jgi:KipI family sensor histidine kinase inhibitor